MASSKDQFDQVKRFNGFRIDYRNINLIALSQIYVFELSLGRMEGKGLLNKLKKYSLDNYVKAIISIFSASKAKNKNSKYLFVNDVFNNSMVQNMRAVQNEFKEDFLELIADKRLARNNTKLIFRNFRPFTFLVEVFKVWRTLKKNRTILDELCLEFGIKRSLLTLNIIDSVFILNCTSRFLNTHPAIQDIVLNTDVHKLSKAIVLLTEETNAKTYVLQHGSTVLEYGYLPVIADYLFTWGIISNNWFIERGTEQAKLITLGTPKMDGFVNYKNQEAAHKQIKTILLILNPIGENNVKEMLQIVHGADLEKGYILIIKLHPGSVDNRDIVEELFKESEVKVIKHANIHDLIYQSDVVITTTSTVGNETIVFNKPLVQIKMANIDTEMEYEKYNCCHLVSNSRELQILLRDPALLLSKKKNYPEFISDYFHRIDGRAAERISNFVKGKK